MRNPERDNALKNRLIDILGRGTAGVGVASSKTIRADVLGDDHDISCSITSSRNFVGELAIEIVKESKDVHNVVTRTKSKLVFERDGLKTYIGVGANDYNGQVLPNIRDDDDVEAVNEYIRHQLQKSL